MGVGSPHDPSMVTSLASLVEVTSPKQQRKPLSLLLMINQPTRSNLMGEEADYLIDQMIDGWFDDSYRPPRRKQKSHQTTDKYGWKNKEGEVIHMKGMKTSHIRNCIKMLEHSGYYPEKLAAFKEVINDRKDQPKDK
jgi:hypothetical protein